MVSPHGSRAGSGGRASSKRGSGRSSKRFTAEDTPKRPARSRKTSKPGRMGQECQLKRYVLVNVP